MATNFRVKICEIGLVIFIRRPDIPKRNSDFKTFNGNYFSISCVNLVTFSPVTLEFKRLKGEHSLDDQQFGYVRLAAPLLDAVSISIEFCEASDTQFYFSDSLGGVTAMPRGLHARLCHAFASRSQRVSLIVIPFCLSVWMSVGHSATYSLPRLIDHYQIWSAGIYLSSDPCKPFCLPYLPYYRCQREKYAKFRLFPTCRQ